MKHTPLLAILAVSLTGIVLNLWRIKLHHNELVPISDSLHAIGNPNRTGTELSIAGGPSTGVASEDSWPTSKWPEITFKTNSGELLPVFRDPDYAIVLRVTNPPIRVCEGAPLIWKFTDAEWAILTNYFIVQTNYPTLIFYGKTNHTAK
jgi:hypothetical protein